MSTLLYWEQLDRMLYESVILQLKYFIFTVIPMIHLACVQIVAWVDIHYVCSAILGTI